MKPLMRNAALWILLPVAIGAAALLLGQDANWDFRTYHYYDPYAFLTGRYGLDILPALHTTYYNPLLDVPVFVAIRHLPAWAVSWLLGSFQGLIAPLLFVLARRLVPAVSGQTLVAALLALAGCLGAMTLSQFGATFHDNTLSVPVLAGLTILVVVLDDWTSLTPGRRFVLLCVAAFLVGAAAGLKLTMSIYALGFAVAVATTIPPRHLLPALLAGALGGIAGFLVADGYWAWFLWHHFGNPFFPHFNNVFQSSFAGATDYRDLKFIEKLAPMERMLLPLFSTLDSRTVSEADFLDARLLAAFVIGLPALFMLRGVAHRLRAPIVFAASSYVGWVWLYCIYRYALPLEMLGPIVVLAGLLALGLTPSRATRMAAAIAVVLIATTSYPAMERVPFADRFVELRKAPDIADPAHTLVLMAGDQPTAFLIPELDPRLRFVRLNDWPYLWQSADQGFEPLVRRTIAHHQGPILILTHPFDLDRAHSMATLFGLKLGESCQQLPNNLTPQAPLLCPAERLPGKG